MSVLDRFRLDGKRALVTGASRGLGREMALALASAGADIVLVARPSADLDSTAEDIRAEGRAVTVLPGDAGVPETAATICEAALTEAGAIDILINNVGGRRENITLQDTSLDTWRTLVDLNLTAAVACTKVIGAAMIERGTGGRIINVASTEGLGATAGVSAYTASKHGVIGLTRALAVELGSRGITVNCICPGPIRTGMTAVIPEEAKKKFARRRVPLRRYGDPEEVAHGTLHLALPASSYINGAVLPVDGGLLVQNT